MANQSSRSVFEYKGLTPTLADPPAACDHMGEYVEIQMTMILRKEDVLASVPTTGDVVHSAPVLDPQRSCHGDVSLADLDSRIKA